jgi:hypothetical protein
MLLAKSTITSLSSKQQHLLVTAQQKLSEKLMSHPVISITGRKETKKKITS